MKKAVKIVGAILGFLMLAIVVLLLAAQVKYSSMAEQRHETPSLELRVTKQPGWPAEGERIARLKGCSDCHGRDMGGQIFIEDPAMGTYAGTNLTSGKGGIGQQYTDKDWVRAIRYGLSRDGKYLRFMPSQEFHALTDEDLGKLIAYLKTLPPVDRTAPAVQVGPMAKVLSMMNQMPLLFSGSHIDHSQPPAEKLEASTDASYGKYLAASCIGCHNPAFTGGKIPGVPPSWPHAADISKRSNVGKWSYDQFKKTLTTGITPEGKVLNLQFMPWKATAAMSDTELRALYNFLQSL